METGTVSAGKEEERDVLLAMNPDLYIKERVDQYQGWYNNKAVGCKACYQRMQVAAVIGAATVPVLVNLTLPLVNYVTTVISLMVVVIVSLESVFHFREQWKNYRSTEQLLGHEKMRYITRVSQYKGLKDGEAFHLFVDRVEAVIEAENAATLNILTTELGYRGKGEETRGT